MVDSPKMNPFHTGYYSDRELRSFGFKALGSHVKIAKNCTIVGLENIAIGSHVIIDSFCSIIANGPGELRIGSYIHIGAFCHLLANDGIEMGDFSGLSQGVKIYSRTDDYTGNSLTNPTIPNKYKNIKKGKVTIGEHVIIGANSIVLPKLLIPEGVSIGALSLVSTSLDSWTMYVGNPLKKIIKRSHKLLEKREAFLKEIKND